MDTLAEALNSVKASAGLEEGRVYLVDDLTDELDVVGEYRVRQANGGPDVRFEDGKFWISAGLADGVGRQTFAAEYDPETGKWTDTSC